jgi:transcriptional regulator
MYVPEQFKETRMAVLAQAIRDVQLATLVTAGMDGYRASHIPMIFKQVSGEMFLEGHVARGNDHWRILREPRVSLAVFLGPQTTSRRPGMKLNVNTGKSFPPGIILPCMYPGHSQWSMIRHGS